MENKQNEKKGFFEKYGVYLIIAFGIFILFNQWQISSLTNTKTSVASVNINTNSNGNANIAQIDISKYLTDQMIGKSPQTMQMADSDGNNLAYSMQVNFAP